ncbi:MAG: prolyl oligopeptidase family serine peptidase [Clostridia bacterium]|nr:prolyl oligopeptidase family serine peptidase [Clostridia bacterium]
MKVLTVKRILSLLLITVLAILALALTSCDGQAGSVWLSGDSAPTADLGKAGDFYLETDSFDVWEYKADGWVVIANIKGEVGATGADGADGEDGAKGEVGDTGAAGADGAKGEVGDKGEKGDKGDAGDAGTDGADGVLNTPTLSLGYLKLSNRQVAVMTHYLPTIQLTAFSGASVNTVTVWAEEDGELYVGTAKVADVVTATARGTTFNSATAKYDVVKGKNTIALERAIGEDETIVLGGQGSVGVLYLSGLEISDGDGTRFAYADGAAHDSPIMQDAAGKANTLVFSATYLEEFTGASAPVIEGVTDYFTDIGSLSGVATHLTPFPYKNIYDRFAGKTLAKIGIPVKTVSALDANQTFTLQIFDYTTKVVREAVTVTLPLDQLGSSTTVNKWVYVDLTPYNISLGKTESIAFGKTTDTVIWGYGPAATNLFEFSNCRGVLADATFNNAGFVQSTASKNSIIFDIYYAIPSFDYDEHIAKLDKMEADAIEEIEAEKKIEFINGTNTEYAIVYDSADTAAVDFANTLATYMNAAFGVNISASAVSMDTGIVDKEIVIGNVRSTASSVIGELNAKNDFAIAMSDNDLVIYATSEHLYPYVLRILKDEIFADMKGSVLRISPEEKIVYSKSDIAGLNYAEYIKQRNGTISSTYLAEMMYALQFTASNGVTLPYRLYVPSDYDPSRSYPVLLMMHGSGDRGNDNISQIQSMVPQVFSQTASPVLDAIVVAPQCPKDKGQKWVNATWADGTYNINTTAETKEIAAVVEILEMLEEKYSCDTNRRYVMGLSMGGYATWDLIARHTEMFTAAIPICGGADTSTATKLKDMPIWAAHGRVDTVVPFAGSENMVNALIAAGNTKVKFKIYDNGAHAIWNSVASDFEMLNWLFEQSKGE